MIRYPIFDSEKNLVAATSTKEFGNLSFKYSPQEQVVEDRQRFFNAIGAVAESGIMMAVNDADVIMDVSVAERGRGMADRTTTLDADALVTTEPGLYLALLTADCLPILYFDKTHHVIALAHCGWKSTDKQLAKKVVHHLVEKYQTNPAGLLVAIGPGVQKQSYVFDNPKQKLEADWQPFIQTMSDGKIAIDLFAHNQAQLLEAGVEPTNLEVSKRDTKTDPELFSHRWSVETGEPEARFVTVVGFH